MRDVANVMWSMSRVMLQTIIIFDVRNDDSNRKHILTP